ncbi:hypothetical protein [Actinomadura verrucosospora]|uniref:Uncharacterized protein n=1 Tax=Actinomadura verrucosospora TaxID=46165 RepID=A0A7D4A0N2_ACTVE|nr:hypothetical protein [Actinomadura verrucosospora]QKG25346.1 hypothetical protein ACTIVE_6997 [Actinomadura verrucosospora]
MRRLLIGVLIVTALAGVGLGHAVHVHRDCAGEPGSRLGKVVDAVTDAVSATTRGSFCPSRRPGVRTAGIPART